MDLWVVTMNEELVSDSWFRLEGTAGSSPGFCTPSFMLVPGDVDVEVDVVVLPLTLAAVLSAAYLPLPFTRVPVTCTDPADKSFHRCKNSLNGSFRCVIAACTDSRNTATGFVSSLRLASAIVSSLRWLTPFPAPEIWQSQSYLKPLAE